MTKLEVRRMDGEINLEEVAKIELGAEGVRITFLDSERIFVGGEIGFALYRKWLELANGERK